MYLLDLDSKETTDGKTVDRSKRKAGPPNMALFWPEPERGGRRR